MHQRQLHLGRSIRLDNYLGGLRRGAGDPTHRRVGSGAGLEWWRATLGAGWPVLLRIRASGEVVQAQAWGEGAEAALDQLPLLFGVDDDALGFVPLSQHRVLVEAHRRFPDVRVGRTDAVFEALAPACLEQVVTGKEAYRAWRLLVREYGAPAPGPAADPRSVASGMRLPPTPRAWLRVPSWTFLAAGVEERRSRTLVRAAGRAAALERTQRLDPPAVDRALRSLPGIGPWTSAEVRQRAHGDADAWSIGDYHVGKWISFALTGEQCDDDACSELLEPYRGHRFRVQLLLGLAGVRPARRGPRMTLPTHTPYATRGRS